MKAHRWTTQYPDLGTGPVPIAPYVSEERFEREREVIYRQTWLNVGRVEEVSEPGDYIVKDLTVCNTSILVVRGKDGIVRGFHNVCSHRGNKVARRCRGHGNGFVCGFHGWAYDLSGNLIHVSDEDEFFDLSKAELGLPPVATDVWEGFIFINLDSRPAQSLKEFLGEPGEGLAGYPFSGLLPSGSYRADMQANWKVTLNSFQEGYHVPFLHRRSAGRAYADDKSPTVHALHFKLYELHRMMSISGSAAYQPTATEMVAFQFGTTVTKVGETKAHARRTPGLNPSRSDNWVFDMLVFFPNFFMFVFDSSYFTYNFWPVSVDRTIWETKTYYPKATNAGQRFSQEYANCALRDTLREDGNTLEAIQATLASGAKKYFILQDQELLVRHSHQVIEDLTAS